MFHEDFYQQELTIFSSFHSTINEIIVAFTYSEFLFQGGSGVICANCNSYNDDKNKFCRNCGNSLLNQSGQALPDKPHQAAVLTQHPANDPNANLVLLGFRPLNSKIKKSSQYSYSTRSTTAPTPPPPTQGYPYPGQPPYNYQQAPHQQNYPSPYQPPYHANMQFQAQPPYQQYQRKPSIFPTILSIIAIISLLVGIFVPLISFRMNTKGPIASVFDGLGVFDLTGLKDTSITYSPISMLAGKPPEVIVSSPISSLFGEYFDFDNLLEKYFREIKNANISELDESTQILKKAITSVQIVGAVVTFLALMLAIMTGIKIFSRDSKLSTALLSFQATLLLLLLFGGMVFLKTLKIDFGEFGAYYNIPTIKLSELIRISPAIGFILLSIGSICALIRAFIKQA